jgi:hypothetical protein
VNVEVGATQDVALALQPKPKGEPSTPNVVAAATQPRKSPTLTAVRTNKRVALDGKLDEPAWQRAWIETNFTQNFPDEAKPPTERTELRVLYDDQAVYIGIRCYDSEPDKIVSRLTRRDRDIEADKVIVDISSRNDHASSYTFQVYASNVQLDGTRFNDTDSSTDWDGIWYSATSRDDKGWVAELEIPLAALRYAGDVGSFGFQVRRYIARRKETDEWAYIPRDAQGEVSHYGTLEGLANLHANRLVQITPYDSRSVTYLTHQGPLDGHQYGGSFGTDLKIGITPSLTFDATINPDFGTVEVDQVILNLTTVELLFPEKRPFFLEGADLFNTPFELFYSRRIGATPPDTQVAGMVSCNAAEPYCVTNNADVQLVQPAPNGQILAAGKLTGSLGNRLSIGAVEAVTSSEDLVINRGGTPTPPDDTVNVAPLTNFAALRLRQGFGLNSSIGLIATSVNHDETPGTEAPLAGDLCPQPDFSLLPTAPVHGRCTNDAYTAGVDTTLRSSDQTWGATGQIVGSLLENGPPRLVPDGTQINPGDVGWGATADAGKYGGEHWLFDLHYDYMTPKLELNDVGYNPSANEQDANLYVTLRSTKPALGFLNTSLRLNLQYESYADNHDLAHQDVGFGYAFSGAFLMWNATLPNFWTLRLNGGPQLAGYMNRETEDSALVWVPQSYLFGGNLGTDPRKSIVGSLELDGFTTVRGYTLASTLTLSFRVLSFLDLDMISDGYYSYGTPRWIDTVPNADLSRTYYFSDLAVRQWDVIPRATLTLSPRLSLQTYAELYLEAGNYGEVTSATLTGTQRHINSLVSATAPPGALEDFRDSNVNVNVFLRWEYRPGSLLWLVYTRHQTQIPYYPTEGPGELRFDKLNGPSTDVFLVKLSYMWEPFAGRH